MQGKRIDFDFEARRSARRRTVSIAVYPDSRVVISAPQRISNRQLLQIVEERSDWVREKVQKYREKAQKIEKWQYQNGEKFLFLGDQYSLRLECGKPENVMLDGGEIRVRSSFGNGVQDDAIVKRLLVKWYVARALETLEARVHYHSRRIGVTPSKVTIKRLKSRWGSCSSRGAISLSWNIIMAPLSVLDYLVVHELCHLVHPNHSREYWDLVASFIPDYLERRRWLRENGHCLSLD